jgi:hypothetical protein
LKYKAVLTTEDGFALVADSLRLAAAHPLALVSLKRAAAPMPTTIDPHGRRQNAGLNPSVDCLFGFASVAGADAPRRQELVVVLLHRLLPVTGVDVVNDRQSRQL